MKAMVDFRLHMAQETQKVIGWGMMNRSLIYTFFLLLLISGGCSLQLVAPYDAKTHEQTFEDARMVDLFYAELQDTPEEKRQYAPFKVQYRQVEAELRSLFLRNKVRKLNEDSTEIAQRILNQWVKCKERHKKTDGYKDILVDLDRDRFRRMFEYAAGAEGAKKPVERGED